MYSREIDGDTLTFAASGWTYRSTFVIYDKQTESIWYHLQGTDAMTCIAGFYADKKAVELPSVFTRWNQWKSAQPATKFLK